MHVQDRRFGLVTPTARAGSNRTEVEVSTPKDSYCRTNWLPPLDPRTVFPPARNEEIPDVRGMLAKNHRFSKLNLEINKAYVKIAPLFQDIYDPDRELSPSWYGFAPFASRQAGGNIRLAERMTAALESGAQLEQLTPAQKANLEEEFPDAAERERAEFALGLMGTGPEPEGNRPEGFIGDVRHLAVAAARLKSLMENQTGSLLERSTRIARTARNMLEAGNRAIVSEIGVAGQDYLNFRKGHEPTPDEVLNNFTVDGTPLNPAQARRAFEEIEAGVKSGGPLRTDWEEGFSAETFDRSNFLVASFAAYEAARLEPNKELKNRWIEQAGILMAYREQKDIVQQAFEDTGRSDEVSRKAVMMMGTPWVAVPTRTFEWSFRDYAENLPPADDSKFTPRAAEYNWAHFPTRWGAILDFFHDVNARPKSIWPMPNPDPGEPAYS